MKTTLESGNIDSAATTAGRALKVDVVSPGTCECDLSYELLKSQLNIHQVLIKTIK